MVANATNKVTGLEYIRLRIVQTDVATRIAHCTDKTGSPIQASWVTHAGGVMHIPMPGELWSAHKLGHTWHLDKQLDSTPEQQFLAENLQPGDTRIKADGELAMQLTIATMNGRGIAPTVRDQFWNPTVRYASVILSSVPATEESIQPFLNGLQVAPNLWFWDGQYQITFIHTMAVGEVVVYYQSYVEAYDDGDVVIGRAVISADEFDGRDFSDAATVVGVGSTFISYQNIVLMDDPILFSRMEPGHETVDTSGLGASIQISQGTPNNLTLDVPSLAALGTGITSLAPYNTYTDPIFANNGGLAGGTSLNGDFTYEAWLKPTSAASADGLQTILCQNDGYGFFLDDSGHLQIWNIQYRDVFLGIIWADNSYLLGTSTGTVTYSAWNLLNVTRAANLYSFYIDGVLDSTFSASDAIGMNGTGIGGIQMAWTSRLSTLTAADGTHVLNNGASMDEIAVYNTALTADRIGIHWLVGTS